MSAICGFKWRAPYLVAPSEQNNWTSRRTTVEQTCSLPAGHEGDHRSTANVTVRGGVSPSGKERQ